MACGKPSSGNAPPPENDRAGTDSCGDLRGGPPPCPAPGDQSSPSSSSGRPVAGPAAPSIPAPTEDQPVRYLLPAADLAEGMSTDDGQDVICVEVADTLVTAHVYTPSARPGEDEARQLAPDARCYASPAELVEMTDFTDTPTPGRCHPDALITLALQAGDLRPGDQLLFCSTSATPADDTEDWRTVELVRTAAVPIDIYTNGKPERAGGVREHGVACRVRMRGGSVLHTDQRTWFPVRRPSGHVEVVAASALADGRRRWRWYRNIGDRRFFDVADVAVSADDEVAVSSSNGNRALYDTCALVEVWRPYPCPCPGEGDVGADVTSPKPSP